MMLHFSYSICASKALKNLGKLFYSLKFHNVLNSQFLKSALFFLTRFHPKKYVFFSRIAPRRDPLSLNERYFKAH